MKTAIAASLFAAALAAAPVPPAPGPESWTFKEELAKPLPYHAREAYRIVDEYGLKGALETVRSDLDRFMKSAPAPAAKTLTLKKGKVDGAESYRVELAPNGDCALVAEDDDGIRRAAYHFEDRVAAGDLAGVTRKPWLRHRISRCYFAPIKRPPFNRDELMDDVDYYPDEYLNRLAHEGVNGLWLTVELRNLVETSFNKRDPDAPKRLAKLRRTVEKCLRYGIRTWIFYIEPRKMMPDSPLLKACPALAATVAAWDSGKVMCPSMPEARQYMEEALKDLFTQVPGLPGVLNISHGERSTTCLSHVDPVSGKGTPCPRCSKIPPWQIHYYTSSSMVKGMRAVNPKAEMISWFYQPHAEYSRAPWVADVARHLPDGVTLIYNFESGALKPQLGRYRPGGDYWLSYVGPAPGFAQVANASRDVNGRIGAKIQVGCSHECATVPFVPVPGLLWRKYKSMKESRCDVVMQCWYFGNYPGVMNKAAGELAFDDFSTDEAAFLERLARPEWGDDAKAMAKAWQGMSDAYADYPLSNDVQYYGPFHAGVAWPLLPDVEMRQLGRTWKPQDAPSGDAIGESLENHTVDEAALLAERMASKAESAMPDELLARLGAKYAADGERTLDLGVMKALRLLFRSGADAYAFYRARRQAVTASRSRANVSVACAALAEMRAIAEREKDVSAAMLPLAERDSRLGFHSEAEQHQFYPAKLKWRIGELDAAISRIDEIAKSVGAGDAYPLSAHEKSAPRIVCGKWNDVGKGFRFRPSWEAVGDFVLEGEIPDSGDLTLVFFDVCGTAWPRRAVVTKSGFVNVDMGYNVVTPEFSVKSMKSEPNGKGWKFRLVLDAGSWNRDPAQRPGWVSMRRGSSPVWPVGAGVTCDDWRLNIGNFLPSGYGRIAD